MGANRIDAGGLWIESIGSYILGTRMNTDYLDIKSDKKPNICGNLCLNLTWVAGSTWFYLQLCADFGMNFILGMTQFISHPALTGWEFKRFYRYREGILDGCKSDRCRWLMNWNNFFCIFLQFVGMRQQNNYHQSWLRQIRYLPMINRSSGHQNQQIR